MKKKSFVQELNFVPQLALAPQLALPPTGTFLNFFCAIENLSPPTAGTSAYPATLAKTPKLQVHPRLWHGLFEWRQKIKFHKDFRSEIEQHSLSNWTSFIFLRTFFFHLQTDYIKFSKIYFFVFYGFLEYFFSILLHKFPSARTEICARLFPRPTFLAEQSSNAHLKMVSIPLQMFEMVSEVSCPSLNWQFSKKSFGSSLLSSLAHLCSTFFSAKNFLSYTPYPSCLRKRLKINTLDDYYRTFVK